MLLEFSVGNYRSIKDIATLSMVAAPINEHMDENTFSPNGKLRLLKSAVFYGANASGKSNLMKAFVFMRKMVRSSSKETQADEPVPVVPFQLDADSCRKSSHFEVVFIFNGIQYRYGFETTSSEITAEWLFSVPTRKEARLFERDNNGIMVGDYFREGKGLEDKTRKNALFLSVVAQFNGETANNILSWFSNVNILSGLNDNGFKSYSLSKLEDADYYGRMLKFMQSSDLDIDDISIETSPVHSKKAREAITGMLVASRVNMNGSSIEAIELKSGHKKYDKSRNVIGTEYFNFDDFESEGTQKMFALSAPVLDTLQNGKVLIVDEFDARLHPLLTRNIIRLFNSSGSNPEGAQLIFNTHDTNLLDRDLFRRDQIWFMEKDGTASSQLYSLVEYKTDKKSVRNDASFEKQYMIGKYGAIPFLGDFESLVRTEK